jgi:hypothetical protein
MKYFLSLLVGLALGIAVAAAALFYNPLTLITADDETEATLVFDYALGPSSVLLETHDSTLDLPVVPVESPLLWEGALKGSILTALPLDSAGGSGALATRLTVPSADTDLLMAGVIAHDYWLVSVPESGSFLVEANSNYWPLLRDTVVRVDLLGREWNGPQTYTLTGTSGDDRARVTGLTGRFTAQTGRAIDRLALEHYDGSLSALSGRLAVEFETTP